MRRQVPSPNETNNQRAPRRPNTSHHESYDRCRRRRKRYLRRMAKILIPLPDHDFDVTEVAVPWKLLVEAGHRVVFATEAGAKPACDPLLITGVVFGALGARPEPIAFYRELEEATAF